MPKRPLSFRESDVKRFIKAVRLGGMDPARVELDPATGRVVVFGEDGPRKETPATVFDAWKAKKDK